MAIATGASLVLLTGGITFTNEWLQTKHVNWRIPIATMIGAAVVDYFGKLSSSGATMFGVMVLIAGVSAPINGKSPIQVLTSYLPQQGKQK